MSDFCKSLPADRHLIGYDWSIEHALYKERSFRVCKDRESNATLTYGSSLTVLAHFVACLVSLVIWSIIKAHEDISHITMTQYFNRTTSRHFGTSNTPVKLYFRRHLPSSPLKDVLKPKSRLPSALPHSMRVFY